MIRRPKDGDTVWILLSGPTDSQREHACGNLELFRPCILYPRADIQGSVAASREVNLSCTAHLSKKQEERLVVSFQRHFRAVLAVGTPYASMRC